MFVNRPGTKILINGKELKYTKLRCYNQSDGERTTGVIDIKTDFSGFFKTTELKGAEEEK